jgi:hypothetical protein
MTMSNTMTYAGWSASILAFVLLGMPTYLPAQELDRSHGLREIKPGCYVYLHADDTPGVSSTFNNGIIVTNEGVVVMDGQRTEAITLRVRESISKVTEVSRNFFAICSETNSVVYFGEDVDIYAKDGVTIISHEGAWRAGVDGAQAGILMPGTFLLGSRYFQEIAPGVAMDRACNTKMNLTMVTSAGTFSGCVKVEETTPLEPGAVSIKVYCPGIGLVRDGSLRLVDWSERPVL